MDNGYPSVAEIDSYMQSHGFEMPSLGNTNYYDQFRQMLYAVLNATEAIWALTVYAPSEMTINIRGGHYNYDGTAKVYEPGEAIDPTDNDTTYVWLNDDNSIGTGVDGDGWPVTEHIRLAEVDVDSDGVVTEIRQLLAQAIILTPVAAV